MVCMSMTEKKRVESSELLLLEDKIGKERGKASAYAFGTGPITFWEQVQ